MDRLLALDLDGTCYDWESAARYLLRTRFGLPDLEEPSRWWDYIIDVAGPDAWDWLQDEGVRLGIYLYGPAVVGCRWGLEKLATLGWRFHVVTHRPPSGADDTRRWVDFMFDGLPVLDVTILPPDTPKSVVAAEILVDDSCNNVTDWRDAGRPAVLFDRPWNKACGTSAEDGLPRVVRAKDWEEVVDAVRVLRP